MIRLHVDKFMDYTFRGGNIDWIISDTIFMGSPSGLLLKPFIISSGAVWSVVEKIFEFFLVSCTNLMTSLARV